MLTVRPILLRDVPDTETMLRRAYLGMLRRDYGVDLIDAALPSMQAVGADLIACGTYFVACKGDQIIGAAGWTDATPDLSDVDETRACVRKVAVHPSFEGHGVGRALMDAVHGSARARGRLWMSCLSSLGAERFYANQGYSFVGRRQIHTGTRDIKFEAIEMNRTLNSS